MRRHTFLWPLAVGMGLLLARPSAADDGYLSYGGTPHLLRGHASVSMRSEVVRIRVGDGERVTVDCRFVFQNAGPACVVRMGFPDVGDEDDSPTKGAFRSYRSSVDGVAVPTRTLPAGGSDNTVWHTKNVPFAAGQTRRVRDIYTVDEGSQILGTLPGAIDQAYYILHTGSSWHDPIGSAEIDVTFAPGAGDTPPIPIALTSLPKPLDPQAPYNFRWDKARPGTVIYQGPSVPTVQGRTLRFVRTNFRPMKKDDIELYFHYTRYKVG